MCASRHRPGDGLFVDIALILQGKAMCPQHIAKLGNAGRRMGLELPGRDIDLRHTAHSIERQKGARGFDNRTERMAGTNTSDGMPRVHGLLYQGVQVLFGGRMGKTGWREILIACPVLPAGLLHNVLILHGSCPFRETTCLGK
jgi:hypothetical protein